MAVYLPIVTQFNNKGIKDAEKGFKDLQTNGEKAQYALKKAAVPAGIAVAALAAGLFDAAKGAIEDQAAQTLLAGTLQKATGATDAQVKANEEWISTQGRLLGITDDELRPVLGRLAKATGSVEDAQKLATQAMDIAASTGKPLATVTASLEKAYGGNLAALAKLAPEYRQMIKDGASFEDVMAAISVTTGGAATDAANTASGQFKRLGVALAETKESIGAALLPAIEAVLPFLTAMGDWAQNNTPVFLAVVGVVGGLALAIVATNLAMTIWAATTKAFATLQVAFNAIMAANPLVLLGLAIAAIVVGLVIAYKKFDAFREIIDAVFNVIKIGVKGGMDAIGDYLNFVLGIYKSVFNTIAKLWNSTIGKLSFSIPDWVPGIGGKGFNVPNIPMLAQGGIVTGPTLALIGESGPEAVVPLSNGGAGLGGGNVTINVNGGDPQQVVNALRRYMQLNGSVPIRVSA